MRTSATFRPFPDLTAMARLFRLGADQHGELLCAVPDDDPIERERRLTSYLLDADRPAWVQLQESAPPPTRGQHGGRRRALMDWDEETAYLEAVDGRARLGEQVTVETIRAELSTRFNRNLSDRSVHRLLARHGWVLTRRWRRLVRR